MATFDLELTISGLCVIVLKASDGDDRDHPTAPVAVDVLAVARSTSQAGNHARQGVVHVPRLSFWTRDKTRPWDPRLAPRLHITPQGQRQAVVDLTQRVVQMECGGIAGRVCSVAWTSDTFATPHGALSERVFNWVPSVASLGLSNGIRVPNGNGDLPAGALCRLSLSAGEIFARDVVRSDTGDPVYWEFPATGKRGAIANEVVYRATGIEDNVTFRVFDGDGTESELYLGTGAGETVQASFSNDVETLDADNSSQQTLDHLKHLASIAVGSPTIQAPHTTVTRFAMNRARTGWPICNQVFYSY